MPRPPARSLTPLAEQLHRLAIQLLRGLRLEDARTGIPPARLSALSRVHGSSVGRYRTDLSAEQLAEVEAEAGPLLRELGYA